MFDRGRVKINDENKYIKIELMTRKSSTFSATENLAIMAIEKAMNRTLIIRKCVVPVLCIELSLGLKLYRGCIQCMQGINWKSIYFFNLCPCARTSQEFEVNTNNKRLTVVAISTSMVSRFFFHFGVK